MELRIQQLWYGGNFHTLEMDSLRKWLLDSNSSNWVSDQTWEEQAGPWGGGQDHPVGLLRSPEENGDGGQVQDDSENASEHYQALAGSR